MHGIYAFVKAVLDQALEEYHAAQTRAEEQVRACKARGLAIGRICTREGKLVATVAQEGLIRYRGTTAS